MLYGGMVKDRRLFAKEKVRFEGDIVAGVAATTAEIAEHAAALIEVDYEPLPAVTDFDAAMADGADLVHPDWESYEAADELLAPAATRSATRRSSRATPTRRSRRADVVVKSRLRHRPGPGRPDRAAGGHRPVAGRPGHRLDVDPGARTPRAPASPTSLQIPESHVRVIVPLLGGGFGAKCDFHFEGHVAALARAAGRPVKLVFSRREEFFAVGHRREGMVIELETGARADGTLVARRGAARARQGRVLRRGRLLRADGGDARARARTRSRTSTSSPSLIYSTNQPSSSIRAPTAPQVCWALEQHMDELAEALGMDPVELRRRTLIEEGSVTATGQVLEQIAMKETLETRRRADRLRAGAARRTRRSASPCGWWPCFAANARRLRQAQPGRHRARSSPARRRTAPAP